MLIKIPTLAKMLITAAIFRPPTESQYDLFCFVALGKI